MSEEPDGYASVAEVFDELAEQLEDVERVVTPAGIEYGHAGRVFAVARDESAEFRLDPEVADAARRTHDTAASGRGVEWVIFSPQELDRFALDRAEAWFLSAWRVAARMKLH